MRTQFRIVSLGASLDHSTGGQLQSKVRLALSDRQYLVFDALELDFIDSAGIGQLFTAVNLIVGNGGDVAIIGANRRMKELFTLVHLDRVAHICPDLAVAVGPL
jgi:anti-anti-sigma factor